MTAAFAPPEPGYRLHGRVQPADGQVYLHPGQFAVSADPCTMTTILGSCVGVCLHDPVAGVMGLNHFLLPVAPAGTATERYGDVAMWRLLSAVRRLGAEPSRMIATVIGGACVIAANQGRAASLGRANVLIAMTALSEAGIRVVARHVEGHRGRRVTFVDGAVAVRIL